MKKLILYIRNLFRNHKAEENYAVNLETKRQTEIILDHLYRVEREKLDRIMEKLNIEQEVLKINENAYDEAQRLYPGHHESTERTAFMIGVRFQYKRQNHG